MATRRLGLVMVLVIFIGVLVGSAGWGADVPRMTKDELKSKLGSPEVVVIDVRTQSDWSSSKWKIKGAVREEPSSVQSWMPKYSKDKTYVLYCA